MESTSSSNATFASPYRDDIVISWPELHRDTRVLCHTLMEKGPFKGIIAIARGGLIPAALVAQVHVLGLQPGHQAAVQDRVQRHREQVVRGRDPGDARHHARADFHTIVECPHVIRPSFS